MQDDLRRLDRPARGRRPPVQADGSAAGSTPSSRCRAAGRRPRLRSSAPADPPRSPRPRRWRARRPPPRRASLAQPARSRDGALIDRGVAPLLPVPTLATGEDIVEYQCHGGRAVVAALIAALLALPGLRLAEPGEFTRRAFANGRIDLTEAEGLAELLEAETEAQRISALRRAEGGCGAGRAWRRRLLELSAEAEVAIDYADEEDGGAAFDPRERIVDACRRDEALLGAPRVERLRDGVRVVVAGPPNAENRASSTRWPARRARSSPRFPGTTRDVVEVPLAIRRNSVDPGRHRRAARYRGGGRADRHRPRRA